MAVREVVDDKNKRARQLAQTLRNDFHLLSNEARKKYPGIREASERGAMRLKHLSEQHGFSLRVLAATDDVVRPLLFACDSQNSRIIVMALSSLQKLIQFGALPQFSVENILATLERLVDNGLEELKVLQTIVILATSTDTIKEKALTQVLLICFKLYDSSDINLHNTASVTIRQIIQALFDRLNHLAENGGLNSPEPPPPDSSPSVSVDHRQLPIQVRDGYLIFQDLCFLINGDPAAWLPPSLKLELGLGLELLEIVLNGYPAIFAKEKLFSVLLTERVCPLVIKLFSPSSKHRHIVSSSSVLLQADKPTFGLHIRLLRILRILIKDYFFILVTQCEIFLSMLVRFLDSDKPLWQRTLAVEVLHLFAIDGHLLKSFCECYDMYEHSTKVFKDIIDGLAAFIHSNFHHATSNQIIPMSGSGHMTTSGSGSNILNQHVFVFRNVTIQYDILTSSANQKPLLLEMLDKLDVPSIPDGYPLILAMTSLLDTIKSLSLVVHNQTAPPKIVKAHPSLGIHPVASVSEAMLNSCWSAVLSALAMLLDTVLDDFTCKKILEAFRLFIELCGTMKLTSPRDAFLTALCKSALPPKYAMTLVAQRGLHRTAPTSGRSRNASDLREGGRKRISLISDGNSEGMSSATTADTEKWTSKNIECILTILHIVHQHGDVLDTAWHLVLMTLQHIVLILGLMKSKIGLSRPTDSVALASINAEKRSELSEITAKLEDLFQNSKFLSDISVVSLVNALCQLSEEAMQNPSGKEISLFPVSCLLEVGLGNISRISIVWEPITSHLIMVCSHNDANLRQAAAESLTTLVKSAFTNSQQDESQSYFLQPLLALSQIGHHDVHQRQLDCIEQLLHSSHQIHSDSWIVVLEVLNSTSQLQSESLVRTGFQSLQLIVTDFLPLLPPLCLPLCLDVTGQYGLQNQDINISLTSIGQLWNIADYLYHNRDTIQPVFKSLQLSEIVSQKMTLTSLHSLQNSSLAVFDTVWMLLFKRLSDLCINEHSAIRKSAAQTLFSTLSAHGSLLEQATWQAVLWQVLFTVLKKVQQSVMSASSSTLSSSMSPSIMIHHSRDTAQKQWNETQVIVFNGVSRVIQSRLDALCQLDGFERAWTTLLDMIKDCTCSGSSEVSSAALNSFKSILQIQNDISPPRVLWEKAWHIWQIIGLEKVCQCLPSLEALEIFVSKAQSHESIDLFFATIPDQTLLLHFLEIFPLIVHHMTLTIQQLTVVSQIFRCILLIPVPKDVSPFLVPSIQEATMTSLQRLVVKCISSIIIADDVFGESSEREYSNNSLMNKSEITDLQHKLSLYPHSLPLLAGIFHDLLQFASYSWSPTEFQSVLEKSPLVHAKLPLLPVNMIPFASSCLVLAVQLLRSSQQDYNSTSLLEEFVKTVHVPLKLRYKLHPSSLWMLPLNSLLTVLEISLPILLSGKTTVNVIWDELLVSLQDFLFCEMSSEDAFSNEEMKKFEELDIKVIELITSYLFPSGSNFHIPVTFLTRWTDILNQGSLHALSGPTDQLVSYPLREHFAQVCFKSLLQLSFMQHQHSSIDSTSQSALNAILERSEMVLKKFAQEERLSGNCPLSRSAMNEVTLVLNSMRILIHSLKQKQGCNTVKSSLWKQVSLLYPVLVDCVTCTSLEVRVALKNTLTEFGDMLSSNIEYH